MSRLIEFINKHPRRLPIFVLVNFYYSLRQDDIDTINAEISHILSILRQDPYALEVVYISILTIDEQIHTYMPLTNIAEIDKNHLIDSSILSNAQLNKSFESLVKCIKGAVIHTTTEQKGDWSPSIIIFTDKELEIEELRKAFGTLHLGYNLLVENVLSTIQVIQLTGKKDSNSFLKIRIALPHAIAVGQEYDYSLKDINVLNN